MDVRCERCKAQYVFEDDQVTASGLTVQCTHCGHLFKVKKKELVVTMAVKPGDVEGTPLPAGAVSRPGGTHAPLAAAPRPSGSHPAAAPPPPAAEPGTGREWRVRQATGNTFAFRELTTLQKWIIEQKVSRDDEISRSGEQWKRLGDIAELASFFQVVEAAERSRAHPLAAQPPAPSFPPPPPSGFPPPAFAAPPPPAPERRPEPTIELPSHEVDLGMDERAPRRRGARVGVLVALGLAVAAGGAYLALPLLTPRPPPPAPPAPKQEAPPPVVEAKPAPPPEPPPLAPVPAPEPVVEQAPAPPEPIVKPPPPKPAAPKGPKALLARAKALLAKGDAAAALELYGRVASDDPENVEALVGRGLCYLDLESWAPAEASFEAALRLQPDEADALLGLAETYRFAGKKADAISGYERYLARHPDGEDAAVARNALDQLRN